MEKPKEVCYASPGENVFISNMFLYWYWILGAGITNFIGNRNVKGGRVSQNSSRLGPVEFRLYKKEHSKGKSPKFVLVPN